MNRRKLLSMQPAAFLLAKSKAVVTPDQNDVSNQSHANGITVRESDVRYLQRYQQTQPEVMSKIIPTDLSSPVTPYADVRRYGVIGDGATDDTAALQTALQVNANNGLAVLIPYGLSVRITAYVQIFSNTTIHLLGTLILTNRQSGLFTNGASNIGIYGNKVGHIKDSSVETQYLWNASPNYAPAIHIRSSSFIVVDGLNISNCCAGVQISNSVENWLPGVNWTLTQLAPKNIKIQNCTTQFCEMSGLSVLVGVACGFYNNYVYRCGDGGLWMMGAQSCEVIGNHRISPQAQLADAKKYGSNNANHPSTWNDVQGMEFQSSNDLLIADNVVENFWFGIDVKDYCNRVMITRNRVSNCEQTSIFVREGDAGNIGSCGKVSIVGNFISNHGFEMLTSSPINAASAAISVSSSFITEIINNVIYSYRLTPCILCLGPEPWQLEEHAEYPGNPQGASVTVSGNCIDFSLPMAGDKTEFTFNTETRGAVVIDGNYTSVKCNGNHIRTDRYYFSDVRENSNPAISLTYRTLGPSYFYPTSASIDNNDIVGWGSIGISVSGQQTMRTSGLSVTTNTVSGAGGTGISLISTHFAICNSNNIAQNNARTATSYGILLRGQSIPLKGVVCSGNSISGGTATRGGSTMKYGIALYYCDDINCTNNTVFDYAIDPILNEHAIGNVLTSGTTTFPRTGAPPNKTVTSYHQGELYYDMVNHAWWIAMTFASTNWKQLTR